MRKILQGFQREFLLKYQLRIHFLVSLEIYSKQTVMLMLFSSVVKNKKKNKNREIGNETLALSLGCLDMMFESRVRISFFRINLQLSSSYTGKNNKKVKKNKRYFK
jgi:hypothetical protein